MQTETTETSTQTETTTPSVWNVRLCTPADAPALSAWGAANKLIDPNDIKNGTRAAQPTVIWAVATKDDVIILAAPVYLMGVLAHLVPSPEADGHDIRRALVGLQEFFSELLLSMGIRSVGTLSKSDYPLAQIAMAQGFKREDRELFVLDLNKQSAIAAKEHSVPVSSTDAGNRVN